MVFRMLFYFPFHFMKDVHNYKLNPFSDYFFHEVDNISLNYFWNIQSSNTETDIENQFDKYRIILPPAQEMVGQVCHDFPNAYYAFQSLAAHFIPTKEEKN